MFMFSTDLYRHRAVTVPTDRTEASLCAQSGGLTPHGRPQGLRAVLSPLPYQQWGSGAAPFDCLDWDRFKAPE